MSEKTNETLNENQNQNQSEKDIKNEKEGKKDKKAVKLLEKQIEDLQKERDKIQAEKDSLNDTYMRMLAEYDNYRKRAQKEKDSLYADTVAETVEKLLPVIDNLERAVAVDPGTSDVKSVLDGVKKVLDGAVDVFTKIGVTEIPAQGENFNPELHSAVMHEDNEDYAENVISDVFMKGYKLGDKVVRHSVVKVMN